MIAARLSSVWQVAGVAGAALCCYLVSQSVASERAVLDRLDRQISHAQDDIRRLGTEIGARSRMAQIDRWNASVLALQAPRPAQFVADGVQLASLYGRAGRNPLPLDQAVMATKGAVDTVAYTPGQAPPAPTSAQLPAPAAQAPAPEPMLRTASFVRPKSNALAAEAPPITHVALSVKPAAPTVDAFQPKIAGLAAKSTIAQSGSAKPAVKPLTIAAKTPAKTVSFNLARLLPSDIGALAAAESKGRKAPAARDSR
jgi:hypothetical protein